MKEKSPGTSEEKRPVERAREIVNKAAEEIKEIIKETVSKVENFPIGKFGKVEPEVLSRDGTIKSLPAIWINWRECNSHTNEIPFALTKNGLYKSSYGLFLDPDSGTVKRFPMIDDLEVPSNEEFLTWGCKALSSLEFELEWQKEKNGKS
jgi:hypothetical protein